MAKKYAAKKREIEQLSNNLAKCDQVIASLKDDLFLAKKKKKDSAISTSTNQGPSLPTLLEVPTVSRIDSSFYPTQEQRPNTAPSATLEDVLSTDSSTSNSSVTLHIIKASQAIYLQMKVDPSITIQNLTNKMASRLLLSGSYSDDFESCSLFFKDKEMINMSRSISDYQVTNNSALVLMPRRSMSSLGEKKKETVQDDVTPSETSNDEKDISLPLQTSNVNVESKLEEILVLFMLFKKYQIIVQREIIQLKRRKVPLTLKTYTLIVLLLPPPMKKKMIVMKQGTAATIMMVHRINLNQRMKVVKTPRMHPIIPMKMQPKK